jgi:hypothetical protein
VSSSSISFRIAAFAGAPGAITGGVLSACTLDTSADAG